MTGFVKGCIHSRNPLSHLVQTVRERILSSGRGPQDSPVIYNQFMPTGGCLAFRDFLESPNQLHGRF